MVWLIELNRVTPTTPYSALHRQLRLGIEKGFQIRALRVFRRVFVSLFTVFADFCQLLNHRDSVVLIHDRTSIVSDASHTTGLDDRSWVTKLELRTTEGLASRSGIENHQHHSFWTEQNGQKKTNPS